MTPPSLCSNVCASGSVVSPSLFFLFVLSVFSSSFISNGHPWIRGQLHLPAQEQSFLFVFVISFNNLPFTVSFGKSQRRQRSSRQNSAGPSERRRDVSAFSPIAAAS